MGISCTKGAWENLKRIITLVSLSYKFSYPLITYMKGRTPMRRIRVNKNNINTYNFKNTRAYHVDRTSNQARSISVITLTEQYVATKTNVRLTTKSGYQTVLNLLKSDYFGQQKIDTVKVSDVKLWFTSLQRERGKRFSTIHSIKSVLKPAFQLAVDDGCIIRNPFDFDLSSVVANDCTTRESLSSQDEKRFLEFLKTDPHFSQYYEGIYILFNTGLRISEFCGLTIKDIDFKKHRLIIDHQLNKLGSSGYYIEKPKTDNGIRIIPMSPDVEACFRTILAQRIQPHKEPVVDGKSGFIFLDKNGNIAYSLHWEHYFKNALHRYNATHRKKLPKITPHICRHTFCSNMAKRGMNPKTLQYIMGHSDISVTLNTYTHIKYEDAVAEFKRLKISKSPSKYSKKSKSKRQIL